VTAEWRPVLADLDAATARTAAAIADPAASLADVERLAAAEEKLYLACPEWPSAEADAELEAGT
jgi:hypothetical protein